MTDLSYPRAPLPKPSARAAARALAYRLRNRYVYRLCEFWINACDNDQDSDFHTNGEAAFAQAMLPNCSISFDVGAAIGDWTAIALAANPSLTVHCFEPSRRFQTLAARGFGKRVVLNRLALGDTVRKAELFYNASGGSNSLFPQRYAGETYDPNDVDLVNTSTMDRYCQENGIDAVDFVKMDIEGYELAALRGAENLIREERIGIVQFEYSYVCIDAGTTMKAIMDYVRSLNPHYEFHKLYLDGTRHAPFYNHRLDNFKTQNWAIIRS